MGNPNSWWFLCNTGRKGEEKEEWDPKEILSMLSEMVQKQKKNARWLETLSNTTYHLYLIKGGISATDSLLRKWEPTLVKARTFWYFPWTLKTEIWALRCFEKALHIKKFTKEIHISGLWRKTHANAYMKRVLYAVFKGRRSWRILILTYSRGQQWHASADFIPAPSAKRPLNPSSPWRPTPVAAEFWWQFRTSLALPPPLGLPWISVSKTRPEAA